MIFEEKRSKIEDLEGSLVGDSCKEFPILPLFLNSFQYLSLYHQRVVSFGGRGGRVQNSSMKTMYLSTFQHCKQTCKYHIEEGQEININTMIFREGF